eukprot:TRINITY_DN4410_c0_g1_i3.p1 TRINITY_DN4410_c0_g1~~TRINITY_DN4410_c0_g1_i3.p1  ORF type:complete len:249 (+),score=71.57 TRINITY_DN4410_c0_g1_i3:25-771(+)
MTEKTFGPIIVREVPDQPGIYILFMNAVENKFNPTFMSNFHKALDYLESLKGPCGVVITSDGKFFSYGLDLDYILTIEGSTMLNYIRTYQRLIARILVLPFPTAAAINGHAYGAGAMLSLACDWRVMRQDRGFWCMPEVNIHMTLPPGMNGIVQNNVVSKQVYRDIVLLGKTYSGVAAAASAIVDQSAAQEDIVKLAIKYVCQAAEKAEDRHVFGALKREMHKDTYGKLVQDSLGESEIPRPNKSAKL